MASSVLQSFVLVGGTALALQIGHRRSDDLDLFTQTPFHPKVLAAELEHVINFKIISEAESTLTILVNETPVDLLKYDYPYVGELIHSDYLRLVSKEDIACMKLSAIASRGSKKDFFDIYFLLKYYTFEEMFGFYDKKYKSSERFHLLKSLVYFDDAEKEPDPILLIPTDWISVKKKLQVVVKSFLN
ncbi:MAG: nucleotidyl transferase AbiEii/AbiGii toxin family protein [Bacteroidetes bacterium]|nr:nucleotidyl transferase AbiEii/AbiGii toxin family protein [Bacteroidota bacterium]